MALSPTQRLIRAQNRHIRDLKNDVNFLMDALWRATGGDHPALHQDCDHEGAISIPVQVEERREEATGITGCEDLIAEMLK